VKTLPLKKGAALGLSLIYFTTQIALGNQAEFNFWADRRKSQNNQLAALPAPSPFSQQISAIGISPRLEKLSARLKPIAESISLANANLQDVYESGDEKHAPVVILQDVHMNSEAQSNLAATLQSLIDSPFTKASGDGAIGLVGVEGAFGPFDFAPFRAFQDKGKVREVTESFLNKNLLAAPSYVGINSVAEPPPFMGVDDRAHYDANVKAYLDSRGSKKEITHLLEESTRALNAKKTKIFPGDLKRFDDLQSAYHRGSLGMGPYVQKLAEIQAPQPCARAGLRSL